jgi:tRNA(Arg) A34 adenosine deaminase TadA
LRQPHRVNVLDSHKGYYGTLLSGVTLYTTLESCAQCSGIMALAKLGRVVFLQTDPGQYSVGNIMRNMTVGTGLPAPHPIPAKSFSFQVHSQLDVAYQKFRQPAMPTRWSRCQTVP